MQTVTLKVEGMSCEHCVNTVEGAVKQIGASGKIDLNAGSVTIQFDESIVSLDSIKEAIEGQGYDVVD
ncbi:MULTISPECIES: copper ion binding protein [unclassified Paenibacillus]|uniref:copper ion binding protein n=1 Tax=unclassified Paenibacillus TaxID=185978 RepID=UPI00104DA1A2|nr:MULTISPECIES: copper ion binding protein [unclassified Paenibacillus]NIK66970.1 copper chaperone [Paenibacillus sp. BK720]TCN01017.1 copper chaperone [Paenibacillus sp. BK033]